MGKTIYIVTKDLHVTFYITTISDDVCMSVKCVLALVISLVRKMHLMHTYAKNVVEYVHKN